MTVYVDDVEHPFGRMIMCHLWADTLPELLAMVDKIGVQRKWIQGHPTLSMERYRKASWCHFDITKSKKALAIKAGAVLTDKYGPLVHTNTLITKLINPNSYERITVSAEDMNRATSRLEMIARLRATTEPEGRLL